MTAEAEREPLLRRIERDARRFRQIIRGHIKANLRQYISRGELIGRQGGTLVSIPITQVDLPRFRYSPRDVGGVGQGPGEAGAPLSGPEPGVGRGAGDQPGDHVLEVDVDLQELAQMMAEELHLPFIQPRGRRNIQQERGRYVGIRRAGPEPLRHFKRTYKKALQRQIASGLYDFANPVIVPVKEDKRYRSWKWTPSLENSAVVIYMMDVSGSMGDEQKEIVRNEAFWIDTWLRFQYRGVSTRYIVHDAEAREISQDAFYRVRESGGTKISSAYRLCSKILADRYPADDWNVYAFHFSDGDNWDGGDNEACVRILREELLHRCNLFCYGQVRSFYGSGQFKRDLEAALGATPNLILSEIRDRDGIYDSIREFLGRGR